ncbi:formin-like protein [Striga asiatica]|uniref:Formin-like protein n=1 Tax=Striga asiatica TaxID=4170 RepID=A0A5A7P7R5_STRAF|nr:formin-like protein [Striga asiatica]
MTFHLITILVIASFNFQSTSEEAEPTSYGAGHRRILHQPLFPVTSPPPTPPPTPSQIPEDEQPFLNEQPLVNELPQYVDPQQPPPLPTAVVSNPAHSPARKLTVAVASAVLTVGMLSAMAFYLHKHRQLNSQKLSDRIPPPDLSAASLSLSAASSQQRPPPPASLLLSPPPMDNTFNYTAPENRAPKSIPHSRRTSPRSNFSPEISLGPLQPSRALNYSPKLTPPPAAKIPIPIPPPLPPSGQSTNWATNKTCRNSPRVQSKSPSPRRSPTYEKNGLRPRMKPLHWDKVGANPDTSTVWDRLKTSSFQLNEDAMESLFGRNSANSVPKEVNRKLAIAPLKQENRILDSKKSQNIAILLRALNVTREEVCEALMDGNPEGLGPELFETLVKMAPSKEEEIKLINYDEQISKMGPAERFLKAMLDIPFAFQRVEAMLYRANFNTEVEYLRKSFQTLEEASEELKNSRLFLKLLEAVLQTGNRMNNNTILGSAKAFKLDTLLKLVDIKSSDGKTTLLHFVVQEIIKSEQTNSTFNKEEDNNFKGKRLGIVSGLSRELINVKKAATMDSDVLSGYVSKLETGLYKIRDIVQKESQILKEEGRFFESMREFYKEAVDEMAKVRAEERKALSLVREVTCYFHGDAEKGSLRIFVIVRDFLGILDNVCKDMGRIMEDRSAVDGGRSFRISATASWPVIGRLACCSHILHGQLLGLVYYSVCRAIETELGPWFGL